MAYTPDPATSSVFATMAMQGGIGLVVWALFEYFRPNQREVYAPRLRSKKSRCPKACPDSPFGWISHCFHISDEDTLRHVGLDGFMFLRFLLLCFKMAAACGVFGLVVLMPVYSTAPGNPGVAGINLYTMGNLEEGGNRLWASFIATYIYTILFVYLLYKEYEYFVALRQRYFVEGDADIPSQVHFSVLVECIPKKFRSNDALKNFFETLYPGQVVSACVAMVLTPLERAVLERKAVISRLECAIAEFQGSDKEIIPKVTVNSENEIVLCGCGSGVAEVAAIPYFEEVLMKMNANIARLQKETHDVADAASAATSALSAETSAVDDLEAAPEDTNGDSTKDKEKEEHITADAMTATGFVTFRSRCAQASAYQSTVMHQSYPNMRVFQCPSPKDIIWSNVGSNIDTTRNVSTITKCVYYAGLIFWAVILAFVAAVSNLSNLETFLPFIKQLDPVSYSILAGQLPVIVLIVFIALLPLIFTSVSTYVEKRKVLSDVQLEVFRWFFSYQLANVYLMLLAGSVFNALSDAINEPTTIVTLLGRALPSVSVFFINFILTALLGGVPMMMLRIAPLAIYKIYRSCFNPRKLTRRTLIEGPLANTPINYGLVVPKVLYILCIALTYWVICPILLAVAALLFGAWYMAWKYQMLYVVVPGIQAGGKFWYNMFNYSMMGLVASTITMIGFMGIKQGAAQTPLLVPLLIFVLYMWGHIEEKFKDISSNMAFNCARAMDDIGANPGGSLDAEKSFKDTFFLPPPYQEPADASPEPYRIDNTPLVDEKGNLNDVYASSNVMNIQFNPSFQKSIDEARESKVVRHMDVVDIESVRNKEKDASRI